MPIIFFNIGWMKRYKGQGKGVNDNISGNFSYIKESGKGHEQFNFLEHKRFMYGFAPIGKKSPSEEFQQIHIERLGVSKKDEYIQGVTVVFISKNPTTEKTYIVGWYKNATVYRHAQELHVKSRKINNENLFYVCKTKAEDAYCLPESKRVFIIPSSKKVEGGYGQSTIWYAEKLLGFQKKVLEYIHDGKLSSNAISAKGKDIIQKDKKKIENTAIREATEYYESLGFQVDSVESDNCGWDLTVHNPDEEFYLEVKGTAKSTVNLELTPNEYEKLQKHWKKYKIVAVTDCLGNRPCLDVFSISEHISKGKTIYIGHNDDNTILELKEKIAVVGRIQQS